VREAAAVTPKPFGADKPERIFRFIAHRAGWILTAAGLLTLAALVSLVDTRSGSLRLRIDPSLDPMVVQGHPDRQFFERVQKRFGLDEVVLVVLQSEDAYALSALQRLNRLTRALRDLPFVAEARSLTSAPLPRATEDGLAVERVTPGQLEDPAFPRQLRALVESNPLLRGHLISADGRSAAIAVALETKSDREILELGVIRAIAAAADRERGADAQIWVTGAPVIRAATSRAVLEQLRWAVPAIALLLVAVLGLAFRSLRGVLLPLATIVIALAWTLAVLRWLDRPLNLITSLVPPLLVTMGLAYCAHVIAEFETLLRRSGLDDARARAVLLMKETAAPVLLTGFTTSLGLLALTLNELPAIREFAWLSALGVLFSALLALTFVPAALCFARPRLPLRDLPGDRLFEQGSEKLARFDLKRRREILFAAAMIFILCAAAATRIQVGDQFVGIFPAESGVRSDYEAVNRALGGVNPLAVVIEGAAEDTFIEPKVLHQLDRLQHWLADQPEVGAVSGLVDHVILLNTLFAGAAREGIPDSADLVRQLLFFGAGPDLAGVVNSDRSSSLIELRLRVDDTGAIAAFMRRLQAQLALLPPPLTAQITGNAALLTRSVERVTGDQLQSIGLALLLIYLCLAVQFASLSVGLKASLPTMLQTALYFGALGLSGIPLNATTALVECLVLGLAVDDTIHYLARFNKAAKRTGSESEGATQALSAVLRPVTLTKAILALGFLILVTGELQNQVLFGYLAAFTLLAAWLVDIFVTPAFMSGVRIVTLWDSLLLNLGREVQSTIPLFAGLSTRQARIFALMSNLQTLPAGSRLLTEGDPGGDVYVLIDGKVSVWVQRDGAKLELNTIGRGAVLGEAGYFGQKRTASADTLTPVRLLRFDDADRERICRRYPRIAARVFLNLNKIQAERIAAQMSRVH
jgi:predicted RND superfamily exporter protein